MTTQKELDGYKEILDLITEKRIFFEKELVLAYEANNKFSLQKQIKDLEKQIGELKQKIAEAIKNSAVENPELVSIKEKIDEEQKNIKAASKQLTPFSKIRLADVVGREEDLENIHRQLTENKGILLLVNGIGGIGKTTAALAYINSPKYTENYKHLAWITILSENLKKDFTEQLSNTFTGYEFNEPQRLDFHFEQLINYLSRKFKDTLLIIDNANDKEQLGSLYQDFLNLGWTILITSRTRHDSFEVLELGTLKPEFAYLLFTKHYKKQADENTIRKILKTIEYHSLLTVLLAKTAQKNHALTLQQLLTLLENNKLSDKQLGMNIDLQLTPDKKNYASIRQMHQYILAIFETQNLNEAEQTVLRHFSVLPATIEIEFTLLAKLFETPQSELPDLLNTLSDLYAKGWLTSHDTAYAIHPLIKEVANMQLKPTPQNCQNVIKWLANKTYRDSASRESNITKKEFLIFGESLANCFDNFVIVETEAIKYLATSYNNLSLIYQDLGDLPKAKEFQLKALEIGEKVLDKNDPSLATFYNNLSMIYLNLDNLQEAEKIQLKALEIRKKVLAPTHPDLVQSYNNLSEIYKYSDDLHEAIEFQLKAIEISEKVLDKNNPNLASSFNNLSTIYFNLGDFSKAKDYQLKALEIRKKVLDKNHPDLAQSYNNLSQIYLHLVDFPKAKEFQLKDIEIKEKVLNANHPALATSYNNLSCIYLNLSDLPKAKDFQLKAIEIREKVLAATHRDFAQSYNNLATIYYEMQEKDHALKFINQAIKILEYNFPNGHPNLETSKRWKKDIEKM